MACNLNQKFLVDALKEFECELGNPTINWKGADFLCSPSVSQFTEQLEQGGFQVIKVLSITIRKDLFEGNLPEPQQTITYNSETYRIMTVSQEPFGSFIRLITHSDTFGV